MLSTSSVADDIAMGYGLDEREVGVRVPIGERFSPLKVQTPLGQPYNLCSVYRRGSFPGK
jgi:hypothetical protein